QRRYPGGDIGSELLLKIIEIGGRVLDRVVQGGGGQCPGIVDAEDMSEYEANAQDVADIRRFTVLAQLALMRPGCEGEGLQEGAVAVCNARHAPPSVFSEEQFALLQIRIRIRIRRLD